MTSGLLKTEKEKEQTQMKEVSCLKKLITSNACSQHQTKLKSEGILPKERKIKTQQQGG